MADEYDEAAERLQENLAAKGGRSKGRRGGGRGGGHGQDRDVLISKALSTLLRHQALNAGVKLDAEGFARLDQVLAWPRIRSLNPTFAEIQHAVTDNAKQRFTMKPNPAVESFDPSSTQPSDYLIRANQGHSIRLESEAVYTPITLEAGNVPNIVVHGTYFAFWPAILASGGLKKMGRTHVHFGTGLPEDGKHVHGVGEEEEEAASRPKVISGMRSDAEVLMFVDVEKSLKEGDMKWWLSANNVVLTEGNAEGVVPLKYFKEIRGRRQNVGVLWKGGEKVADLPEGIVARAPQGKRGQGSGDGGGRRAGRGGKGGSRGGRASS